MQHTRPPPRGAHAFLAENDGIPALWVIPLQTIQPSPADVGPETDQSLHTQWDRISMMSRVRNDKSKSTMPRYWPIVAVFVAMTMLQALVAGFSIQMLSTVRAYVTGESLYSKGQKDAQSALLAYYSEGQHETDYVRFVHALADPLGDRAAREALQLAQPDTIAARKGFLDGGNHPDDIEGLIRLFRWFQHVSFMAKPIATWTEGDQAIQEMRSLFERGRRRVLAGDSPADAVDEMRMAAPALNERLTRLTTLFSFQLGEASRTTQQLLLALNGVIALLLTLSGLVFVRRSVRRQASSELRLLRLIDAVTDGVVTVDDDRNVILFNRAAEILFGVEARDAFGTSIDLFVTDAAGDPLALVPTSGSLRELVGSRSEHPRFPAEASVSRLETEAGALTTIVLRDITAKRLADAARRDHEALEASGKAKTEFLSRMSHELRTPLNAVIGFSGLLRTDTADPLSAEQTARLKHVENAGKHLLALVNDVLDLSRIESGELAISTKAVSLVQVVEEASQMVATLATETGIELLLGPAASSSTLGKLEFPSVDFWVEADAVRLRQVLVNLLSNAIKYNKPHGSVCMTWRLAGEHCEVRIVDTGRGIPVDQLKSLFEPFNRLGAESSPVVGTGIGLVLSRELTETMGGRLQIISTFGQGTCATLTLPIADPRPATVERARCIDAVAANDCPLSVLYAEDNEVNAELVRALVTLRKNVTLRVAPNGALALQMARMDPPDLMLVDMNLGDMTGLELADRLQCDRITRGIPLVALSADALPEQIQIALRSGFDSYMTKPIDFEEMLALLDKHSLEAASDVVSTVN